MPEDYYGDEDAQAPATASTATSKEEPGDKKTALIDSAICPGMEPGEEMVVKIEKVMDKEYLVSYAPEPGDEEEPSEPAEEMPAPEAPAPSMAGMME